MSNVFLSYSSEDEVFVRELYLRLKRDGVDCFFDRESIKKSADWVATLGKKLKECQSYVVVLTPAYYSSDWAQTELSVILNEIKSGEKKVVPLLLKDCTGLMNPFLEIKQSYDLRPTDEIERQYVDICKELGKTPKEEKATLDRGVLPAVGKLPARSLMNYFSLGDNFKGRVKDLWAIHDLLRKQGAAVVQGVGVVVGMGGIGKTQLAIEYVHRFGRFYKGGVFWVDVEQGKTTMINQVSRSVGIQLDPGLAEQEQLTALWQHLNSLATSLLVLDNFPLGESLQSWRPTYHSIGVLVTTQRKDFAELDPLNLDVLTKKEGIELLNSGNREFGPEAGELVNKLGGLPLALELTRKFLDSRNDLSISDLINEIKKRGEMESLKIFAQKYKNELPTKHSKEVAATFQLSYDMASDFAKDVMAVIALLAPAPVPQRILQKIFDQPDHKTLDDPLAEALSQLHHTLSLLEQDRDTDPTCHRLIAAFVCSVTKDNTGFHEKIISTLLQEMLRSYDTADTPALRELEKVLPHADHLLTHNKPPLSPAQQVSLSQGIGAFHTKWGRYRQAESYMQQALDLAISHYPAGNPEIATCYTNLGYVLDNLGKYQDAIDNYEQANKIYIQHHGEDHANVAVTWNNLGLAYDSLGQYEKAIKYYEKALESDLKTYGKDHPLVAIKWNNLGGAYYSLGQYDKAIEYFEKALESDLITYGKDHSDVAIDWNNLGEAYRSLGQHDKAVEYYEKALESGLKTYGKDHPQVAIYWNNLGEAYRSLGQYDKAIEYYEQALAVFKKMLGDDHPSTKTVQNNLDLAREMSVADDD